jgi:hypothetical protein
VLVQPELEERSALKQIPPIRGRDFHGIGVWGSGRGLGRRIERHVRRWKRWSLNGTRGMTMSRAFQSRANDAGRFVFGAESLTRSR